jgi:hypothetical protein
VDDATGYDAFSFYLAHVHPLWMLASIALAAMTLRAGLRLRTARRRGLRKQAADYRAHLRLAKPTLLMLWTGFALGLGSAVFIRGWDAFGTAHGIVSSSALVLFTATALLGRRLETGTSRDPEVHGLLGLLSVLAAGAAFGTGFVLLP